MKRAALLLLLGVAAAHPRHTSLADAELRGGTLEVVLRVAAADLQEALPKADLERAEAPVAAWLTAHFELRGLDGPIPLRWVGFEVSGQAADLYFEADLPAGTAGVQVRNTLFFEQAVQQINLLNVASGAARQTLLFTARSPTATLK